MLRLDPTPNGPGATAVALTARELVAGREAHDVRAEEHAAAWAAREAALEAADAVVDSAAVEHALTVLRAMPDAPRDNLVGQLGITNRSADLRAVTATLDAAGELSADNAPGPCRPRQRPPRR